MSDKLYVSNLAQKVIFLAEMAGQISDGMWENARPEGHYKVWSALKWDDVIIGADQVGRNFYAIKSNYNLNAQELIDIVGERIIYEVKAALLYPVEYAKNFKEKYHWNQAWITDEMKAAITGSEVYNMKMLRRDIAGLRKAMGTRLTSEPKPVVKEEEWECEPRRKMEVAQAVEVDRAIPATGPTTKEFRFGRIEYTKDGWYQFDPSIRVWRKVNALDDGNTNPVVSVSAADLL